MYLLFSGEDYYPCGGWEDFKGAFDSLQKAKSVKVDGDWAHIVEMESQKKVCYYQVETNEYAGGWVDCGCLPSVKKSFKDAEDKKRREINRLMELTKLPEWEVRVNFDLLMSRECMKVAKRK